MIITIRQKIIFRVCNFKILHNHKNLITNTKKTKYVGLYYSTGHGRWRREEY